MNKLREETRSFCAAFLRDFKPADGAADVGIAPPYTAIQELKSALAGTKGILLGAQNVHWLGSGAHTGEISPAMLADLGVDFAIVGHSERRQFYGEASEAVAERAKAAIQSGLTAVICIGETKEQFEAKRTKDVVKDQLQKSTQNLTEEHTVKLVIAYEPVWAIGTGLAATPEIASDVHDYIRSLLTGIFPKRAEQLPILYGGSTTPENIASLMSQKNINGALVGGTSLKPDLFWALIENGRTAGARR